MRLRVGLYVHVPFCATKCGYCDFYSHVPMAGQVEQLVDALLAELDSALAAHDAQVETIFIGGGTPTVLPMVSFERLFAKLGRVTAEHAPVEFTVEVNPVTLTDAKARFLHSCGVTRISMGAQSFHAPELRVLDRTHGPGDMAPSAAIVRRAAFEHFNLDLIFGIPGQTLASWRESLRRGIELGPDHLACYGLTYERGTTLRARRDAGRIQPVDEELEAAMYEATMDQLAAAGFEQYEISNYARGGGQCRHNLRYWRNQATLGIGPSAASYIDGRRRRNVADTAEYVRCIHQGDAAVRETEALAPLERAGETAMLMLRLNEGIQIEPFRRATGFDARQLFADTIAGHSKHGLLTVDVDHVALTRRGRLVANTVIADFLMPKTNRAVQS